MPRRQSTATKSSDAGQVFLSGAAQENSKETLETLWFSCGLPEAERAAALEAISSGVKGFLEQAVKSQKEAVAKLEKEIPLLLEEMKQLGRALEEPVEQKSNDPQAHLLVPRHRALSDKIDAFLEMKDQRLVLRRRAAEELDSLRDELREADEAPPAPRPAEDADGGLGEALLAHLQAELEEARTTRAERVDASALLSSDIARLKSELGDEGNPETTTEAAEKAKAAHRLSKGALAAMEAERTALSDERARRLVVATERVAYIDTLASKLQLGADQRVKLPAAGDALSLADLQAYATEAARLDGLKKSCLGKLLAEARGRLVPLWAELHIPDEQARKRPAAWATHGIGEGADSSSNSAEKLEEKLEAVEAEEAALTARKEASQRILSLLEKRSGVLGQRTAMLEAQAGGRDLSKMRAGELLKEEKLRTAIERDLPKMNKKLRELCAEWEGAHPGEPITYDGMTVVALVEKQEADDVDAKKAKEAEQAERKAAKEAEKKAAKEAALAARNGGPPMAVMGSANRPGSAAPPRPAKSDFGPPPRPISAKPKLGRPVQGKALAKAGIAAPPPELARQPLGVNSPRK